MSTNGANTVSANYVSLCNYYKEKKIILLSSRIVTGPKMHRHNSKGVDLTIRAAPQISTKFWLVSCSKGKKEIFLIGFFLFFILSTHTVVTVVLLQPVCKKKYI